MAIDVDLHRRTISLPAPGKARPLRFSAIDAGPRDALRTLVFLHGFGGRAAYWHYQLDHFHFDSRVIALDLRGHGLSDAPHSRYDVAELCADVVAMLDALGAPARFVLVAHSFGGAVSAYFQGLYPERVERFVIIGSAVAFRLKWTGRALLGLPAPLLRLARRLVPAARLYPPAHVVSAQFRNALSVWDGTAHLKRIVAPTLVILGHRDLLFEEASQRGLAQLIPGAEEVVIPVSAHQVMVERPDAVNRAIERFLGPARLAEERAARRARARELERERPWLKFYDSRTPYRIRPPVAPITRTLEAAARRFAATDALRYYGRRITYRQLNRAADRFANGLARLGVAPGARVAIMLPNIPQAVIAYYGVLKLGAVAVFVNPLFSRDELVARLTDAGARVLVALSSYRAEIAAIAAAAGLERVILASLRAMMGFTQRIAYSLLSSPGAAATAPASAPIPCEVLRFSSVLARGGREPLPAPEMNSLAVIAYTSGTTGAQPAGVMLTHANLAANALQLRHWTPEIRPGDERLLAIVPFSHSYGITGCLNIGVLVGATLILLPRFDVQETLETIAREKPTIFPGVPQMFQSLALFPGVRKYGIASIRLCVSSGSPLPLEVQEEFEKLTRGRVVEAYGLTEASPATHCNPLGGQRRHGSIGVPLPDTEARVVDAQTGAPLPPGEAGELVVRGPQLMAGYWQRPAETAAALRDGWLYTGDVARVDEDGFFYVIDRRKDVIFAGGYPVYPRDIEEVLYEHPLVLEAAVVGLPEWQGAAAIRSFVVARPGSRLAADELRLELQDLMRRRLPAHAVPGSLAFVDRLPRNLLGKVLRRQLATMAGSAT
ncbi:MAG: alpha/beta fold hydrolase [Burkholderiales bacterium]|nr:alpha/beta fold hydrolase [Burkholderiales bacterium]